MGRMYTAQFSAVAVTVASDLFEITVATDKPIRIHGFSIWQTTDVGDAAEEVIGVSIIRGVTAGSGGTSVTPTPTGDDADTAAGATVNRTTTTASTGGTRVDGTGWNVRVPCDFWPPPEWRPRIDAGVDPVVIKLDAAPADSLTISGYCRFEEI